MRVRTFPAPLISGLCPPNIERRSQKKNRCRPDITGCRTWDTQRDGMCVAPKAPRHISLGQRPRKPIALQTSA